MFTGLIEATGQVEGVEVRAGGRRLRIATSLGRELHAGDSIATSGVCLTAVEPDADGFFADVSPETLRVTTLGALAVGRSVNLERPLRADARLGGHFVLGHVDGVGRIASIRADDDYRWIEIEYPPSLAPLLILKGSVAVDGISLTVAALSGPRFAAQVVPFTWTHTALQHAAPGEAVNLEADVLGKYVVRLLEGRHVTS
jgi:riboflavin synthase